MTSLLPRSAIAILLACAIIAGCQRKVRVKLKVKPADAGMVITSTASAP